VRPFDELEWDPLTNSFESILTIHLRPSDEFHLKPYWRIGVRPSDEFIWIIIVENTGDSPYFELSCFSWIVIFSKSTGIIPYFIPYCYYYCFFPCIFPYQNTVDIYHRKTRIVTIEFTLEKANLENTGDSPYFELSCFSWIVIFGRSTGIILILSLPVIVVVYPTIILLLFFIIPY
jgi:hypothetical protein